MSKIMIWGRLNSANVQKPIWALEELALAYDHVPLGGKFGGLDAPDYLAMNPNGKVPTLRDGDLTLWESHSIVRYLAATYGRGTLWPEDPRARAMVDQWADWTATTFQPAWIDVFWLAVRTPVAQQNPVAIEKAKAAAFRAFAILDNQLAKAPFVAGDTLTYADIVAGVSMFRWMTMAIERPEMPNLSAWHERLQARPAFRKAVCVSYEDLIGRLD
jgi:glutathione S-transferase